MHSGEVLRRKDGRYTGECLERSARLLAIGHAGQILVSEVTAALVGEAMPDGATLVDLGAHQLKDLGRPVRVWQLVDNDGPRDFPPLRSLRSFRHNLPTQLTPLIARTAEIADVDRLLGAERLVTITGPAGVGKTRLAQAVAAEAVVRFVGGAWWVDLAPLNEGQGIGRAALAVLSIAETPAVPAPVQLAAALGTEPTLVVLDNCEHLSSDCAGLVRQLLEINPAATVLATSREPLGVPGEVTWPAPSLELPVRTLRPDDVGAVRRGAAVRRSGPTGAPVVRRRRGRGDRDRGDLSPLGRDPVGDRARRVTMPPDDTGAHPPRARRPVPGAHRWIPHGAATAADARRVRRLESRSPRRRGAASVPPAGRVRRSVPARDGRSRRGQQPATLRPSRCSIC